MVTSNSDSAFAKAAIDALRQWHFKASARPEDATTPRYVTTVFLTPPQGMPLQFAVDSAMRRRLTEHDGVVDIHEGKDWIYSALLFGDFDFTADVRSARSMSCASGPGMARGFMKPDRLRDRARRSGRSPGGDRGCHGSASATGDNERTTPRRRRRFARRPTGAD